MDYQWTQWTFGSTLGISTNVTGDVSELSWNFQTSRLQELVATAPRQHVEISTLAKTKLLTIFWTLQYCCSNMLYMLWLCKHRYPAVVHIVHGFTGRQEVHGSAMKLITTTPSARQHRLKGTVAGNTH